MMRNWTIACMALMLSLLLLAGCAAPQQQQTTQRFFWPRLPERPRIEWLKSYSSQFDFPRSSWSYFTAAVVGEGDALTFEKPLDIRSNNAGKVFIADPGVPTVYVYDFVNSDVYMLGREKASQIYAKPVSVAINERGEIFVVDAEKKAILVFDKDERLSRALDYSKYMESGGGIAVDTDKKRLICVDTRGHKLVFLDYDGNHLFTIGKRGGGNGGFNYPGPVTMNSRKEIIVGDNMNALIQIFDQDGKFLRQFGRRGDGRSEFQMLKGVAVDSDDNIYVTDGKGNKVEIFNTKGEYLLTFGGSYSVHLTKKEAPGGFLLPQGIAIDKTDTMYVVDQGNYRFQVFRYISDSYLKNNPIPGYPPPEKDAAQ